MPRKSKTKHALAGTEGGCGGVGTGLGKEDGGERDGRCMGGDGAGREDGGERDGRRMGGDGAGREDGGARREAHG